MSGERHWEWHVSSEPALVREALIEIQGLIDGMFPGQTPEERGDLRLVFSELLNNAVIHGNRSDSSKKVHVCLTVSGSQVRAMITDEGGGYNYSNPKTRITDKNELFLETGRGMKLVHALTDGVSFDRNGKCVVFVKNISGSNG